MKTIAVLGFILIGLIYFISRNKYTFKTILKYIIVIFALISLLIILLNI